MTAPFNPQAHAYRTIEALGGQEKAFELIDKEFGDLKARWNQDVDAIGRILRSHLYVEHYMTEFLEKANPRLGALSEARLTFMSKVHLLADEPRIQNVVPGIKRLNAIRNRLAHSLDATVTKEDAEVFLLNPFFKALQVEGAKPGVPSDDPMNVLERFAQYAAGTLAAEFSVLFQGFQKAFDLTSKGSPPDPA